MLKKSLIAFLLFVLGNTATLASHFTACESTYALCTTAACQPLAGKKNVVSCACDVKTGYSAGTKSCQKSKDKQHIFSRYYPIKSYARCENNRPWAWCLDKPCVVDKNDPSKAQCLCKIVKNLGPYIIVTDTYNESTCTTGIISSATVKDANQVTDFLKTQKELQPYPIEVINSKK